MTPAAGPVFNHVHDVLAPSRGYAAYRAGVIDQADFAAVLESRRAALVAAGIAEEDIDYAKRYPADGDAFVRTALDTLHRRGAVTRGEIPAGLLAAARAHAARFDHGGRKTYIYPEEYGLLAAIATLVRPHAAVFLGSYYGYWASAAVPFIAAGGTATLVDPDPACCDLAARNFATEIAAGQVAIACTTGEAWLVRPGPPIDLLVIDAELPRDHPDEALRGKGVYASLLAAALPRLAPRALLVCHNILLHDRTGAPVFDAILARNRRELAAFNALVEQHFADWTEFASTEGVGAGTWTGSRR